MVDNLFIVESPLQALVAVELSLQFEGQTNGIIYRLWGKGRERNDEQICRVVDIGEWSFREPLRFVDGGGVKGHLDVRKVTSQLGKRFRGNVRNLFFGEFRSQWMHFARLTIVPDKFVLMDDGAATLTAKSRYIDQGIFYPRELWVSKNPLIKAVKDTIYWRIFEAKQAQRPVIFASAFLKNESEFNVDFSLLRKKVAKLANLEVAVPPKAYFFGSKYSEADILSLAYELYFISCVLDYYENKGLALVYCAHRDESEEKLDLIRALGSIEVVRPDLPAELFVLERGSAVAEIGAAYSSVINNLGLIFPDKPITSFRLDREAVNPRNRDAVDHIYDYFEQIGVTVERW